MSRPCFAIIDTRAFVANIGSGSVTVIDLERGTKLADLATGDGAEGIAITPDGRQVWVNFAHPRNDTVQVIETYIGHDTEVKERLRSILRRARDIRGLIQEVGKNMTPAEAVPAVVRSTVRS